MTIKLQEEEQRADVPKYVICPFFTISGFAPSLHTQHQFPPNISSTVWPCIVLHKNESVRHNAFSDDNSRTNVKFLFRDVTTIKPFSDRAPNQLALGIACGTETTLICKDDMIPLQSDMFVRRPLLGLPLTQNYRRLRSQWCDERRMWAAEWNDVVFTDGSSICLQLTIFGFESGDTVERE
ncbi:transposable element Tcb1 transposase [Trichonephila clavipes]|nr:transposable element Tcb1 transposase [Trichonephila clavipes]